MVGDEVTGKKPGTDRTCDKAEQRIERPPNGWMERLPARANLITHDPEECPQCGRNKLERSLQKDFRKELDDECSDKFHRGAACLSAWLPDGRAITPSIPHDRGA